MVGPRHPLAGRKRVSIEELGEENFVAHNVPLAVAQPGDCGICETSDPAGDGVELPSLEAIKQFVAMGNGVAFVPGLTVERELRAGELVKVPVEALRFERRLRLIHRKRGNLSHAATAFLKVVRLLGSEMGQPFEFRVERSD